MTLKWAQNIHRLVSIHISGFLWSTDAFTDIGWFLYISLDSYKVWMHLQTLVGFCTYLLILIKYGCIYRHWLLSVHISWFLYKVWMHLQTVVGLCTYLWILIKYGCIYRHITKRAVSSGLEQFFDRAWNWCPSLRLTHWLKMTGLLMHQQQ